MGVRIVKNLTDDTIIYLEQYIRQNTQKGEMERDESIAAYLRFAPPEVMSFFYEVMDTTFFGDLTINSSQNIGVYMDARLDKLHAFFGDEDFNKDAVQCWLGFAPMRLLEFIDNVTVVYVQSLDNKDDSEGSCFHTLKVADEDDFAMKYADIPYAEEY